MFKKTKIFFSFALICVVGVYVWFIITSLSPSLPQPGDEVFFYSNQCRQDLRIVTIKALKKANKSIYMVMFGLSDISIIKTLKKKSDQKLNLKIFYDQRSSPTMHFPKNQAHPLKTKGLMHQKIF